MPTEKLNVPDGAGDNLSTNEISLARHGTGTTQVRHWLLLLFALITLASAALWYKESGDSNDKWARKVDSALALVATVLAIFGIAQAWEAGRSLGAIRSAEQALKDEVGNLRKVTNVALKQITDAECRLEQDIKDLEDATRRSLSGFVEIFDRSLWLLSMAEREVIYVNFVLHFGRPHLGNDAVKNAYEKLERRQSATFEHAVADFKTALQNVLNNVNTTKIKIMTLTPGSVRSAFLDRLVQRGGYDYLDGEMVSDGVGQDGKTLKMVYGPEYYLRNTLTHILNARKSAREDVRQGGIPCPEQWSIGERLPIQVLIAGLPPRTGQPEETRFGCVVFLLGTEGIGGIKKSGEEMGFYTELPHQIQMWRSLVENVCQDFKTFYPDTAA